VFTGPECTGKTILSEGLSEESGRPMVPEYARVYLEILDKAYSIKDLDNIAIGQLSLETEESLFEYDFSICDTDLTVLYIWSAYKYGKVSDIIEEGMHNNLQNKHYFLCYPDIPWEPDPQRENPNDREELFDLYEKLLNELEVSYTVLKGSIEQRLDDCRQLILDRGFIL
jgi:nicotinamide riboside kinase